MHLSYRNLNQTFAWKVICGTKTRSYKKNFSADLCWILLRRKFCKEISGQKFWSSKIQRNVTLKNFYRIGSRSRWHNKRGWLLKNEDRQFRILGGRIAQWIAFSLRTQRLQVRFFTFPKHFLEVFLRFIDCTATQRRDYVNWAHLVLAIGKLVLQQKIWILIMTMLFVLL